MFAFLTLILPCILIIFSLFKLSKLFKYIELAFKYSVYVFLKTDYSLAYKIILPFYLNIPI